MPRPCRNRRVCAEPAVRVFAPQEASAAAGFFSDREPVRLLVEEYEAIRLIDYERRTHESCAVQMCVSRTTVTEIYERARAKFALALVEGRTLRVEGGSYTVCGGADARSCAGRCRWKLLRFSELVHTLTQEGSTMKIAVPVKHDAIYQHFGMAAHFKVYTVDEDRVVATELIEAAGRGHGSKVGPLVEAGVDCVICGGIGDGATSGLASAGIFLIAGIEGDADEAVAACLAQSLKSNPEAAAAVSRYAERHANGEAGCCGHGKGGCGGHHGEGECGCGGHHGDGCGCDGKTGGGCGCGGRGHGHGCGCHH